ncbi:proline--tRNA ligase, partial [Pediococcus pentosaceus]
VDSNRLIKTMVLIVDEAPVLALLRGNDQLNEVKLTNLLHADEVQEATEEEAFELLGAHVGSLGPVLENKPENLKIVADKYIEQMVNSVVGANEDGFHLKNVNVERDFTVDEYADIRTVREGELAPDGKGALKFTKGIEIGHIFKIGTKYSEALDAKVLDENGRAIPVIMGCYGIGVSRLLSAVSEQQSDDNGLVWPKNIAPYDVHVIPVNAKNAEQMEIADQINGELTKAGYDVLVDDRKERAGVKFADSDLIGIPLRVTIGKKASEGIVEVKLRKTGEAVEVKVAELNNTVEILLNQAQ